DDVELFGAIGAGQEDVALDFHVATEFGREGLAERDREESSERKDRRLVRGPRVPEHAGTVLACAEDAGRGALGGHRGLAQRRISMEAEDAGVPLGQGLDTRAD